MRRRLAPLSSLSLCALCLSLMISAYCASATRESLRSSSFRASPSPTVGPKGKGKAKGHDNKPPPPPPFSFVQESALVRANRKTCINSVGNSGTKWLTAIQRCRAQMESGKCDNPAGTDRFYTGHPDPVVPDAHLQPLPAVRKVCQTREGVKMVSECPVWNSVSRMTSFHSCYSVCVCTMSLPNLMACKTDMMTCVSGNPLNPEVQQSRAFKWCARHYRKCEKECNGPLRKCVQSALYGPLGALADCVEQQQFCNAQSQNATQAYLARLSRQLQKEAEEERRKKFKRKQKSPSPPAKMTQAEMKARAVLEAKRQKIREAYWKKHALKSVKGKYKKKSSKGTVQRSSSAALKNSLSRDMMTTVDRWGNVIMDDDGPDADPEINRSPTKYSEESARMALRRSVESSEMIESDPAEEAGAEEQQSAEGAEAAAQEEGEEVQDEQAVQRDMLTTIDKNGNVKMGGDGPDVDPEVGNARAPRRRLRHRPQADRSTGVLSPPSPASSSEASAAPRGKLSGKSSSSLRAPSAPISESVEEATAVTSEEDSLEEDAARQEESLMENRIPDDAETTYEQMMAQGAAAKIAHPSRVPEGTAAALASSAADEVAGVESTHQLEAAAEEGSFTNDSPDDRML